MSPLLSRLIIATPILFTGVCMASLCSYPSLSTAQPVERIALQLHGPRCNAQQTNILSVLSPLPGVRGVDLSSVPGHALIDLDTGDLSPQNLIETVRELWHDDAACLVEPMQSCISAGPLTHSGRPSADHAGMVP
jgi:hypothetical protein